MKYIIATIVLSYIFAKLKTLSLENKNALLDAELTVIKTKREEEREKYLNRIYILQGLLDKEVNDGIS